MLMQRRVCTKWCKNWDHLIILNYTRRPNFLSHPVNYREPSLCLRNPGENEYRFIYLFILFIDRTSI